MLLMVITFVDSSNINCRETAKPYFGKELDPDENGTSTKTVFGGRGNNLIKRFATDNVSLSQYGQEK